MLNLGMDCPGGGRVPGNMWTLRRPEMIKRFVKLMNDSRGATAIEYGLIAALIAVAAITAMKGIGTKLNSTFTSVSNDLK